jgi:S-DNA-T family DNA segregation ATPase FtsK/SpoIIIE
MEKTSRIKDEIIGVLFILTGIVVLVSLVSHSTWDSSLSTESPELKNLLGPFGSYLSDILLQIAGLSSYFFSLVLVISGIKRVLGRAPNHRPVIFAVSIILLIISSSSLLALALGKPSDINPSGGIIGYAISSLSLKLISTTGSYLLFIPFMILTLMYLVPFSIVDIIRNVRDKTSAGAKAVSSVRFKKKEPPRIKEPELPERVYEQEPLPLKYVEPVKDEKPRMPVKAGGDYKLPDTGLLADNPSVKYRPSKDDLLKMSGFLEKKLQDFMIEGKVTHVSPGPVVTMFEFEPAPGIKISKIISLSDDLAMAFKVNSLRISPILGKATLGMEIPNSDREDVFLKDIFKSEAFKESSSKLALVLGKDIFGTPVTADLSRMPHLLVAGATGAGKSVTVNAMILSILYRLTPDEVKMLMIDPKMLELSAYEGIPHLLLPVVTSPKEAAGALKKIVFEMERRYRRLAETGSRNIEAYNRKIASAGRSRKPAGPDHVGSVDDNETMPYIIVIIDELADLMLVSGREVEDSIARLAQMARAAGIHLIIATQRPSVDVITGVIKANFPSRIAFHVSSKIDSRIIIDTYGAEKLLGKGDMLFMTPGRRTMRAHGAYVSEDEVRDVVAFIKAQREPDYTLFENIVPEPAEESESEDRDELYQQAKDLILSTGQASISYIQRRMKIGYNRAARIMEMMEDDGIVGPPGEAGKPRDVLKGRK